MSDDGVDEADPPHGEVIHWCWGGGLLALCGQNLHALENSEEQRRVRHMAVTCLACLADESRDYLLGKFTRDQYPLWPSVPGDKRKYNERYGCSL